jgi:hypothetical protein
MNDATRRTLAPAPARPELAALLEAARNHKMTPDEIEAQRRSWVIGELMLDDEAMTREDAEKLYDQASVTFNGAGW